MHILPHMFHILFLLCVNRGLSMVIQYCKKSWLHFFHVHIQGMKGQYLPPMHIIKVQKTSTEPSEPSLKIWEPVRPFTNLATGHSSALDTHFFQGTSVVHLENDSYPVCNSESRQSSRQCGSTCAGLGASSLAIQGAPWG